MLAGACARTMRLELQLQVLLLLQPLGRSSHLCEGEDAKEVRSHFFGAGRWRHGVAFTPF